MKQHLISSAGDLDRLEAALTASAEATLGDLKTLLGSATGLNALAVLKFTEAGRDPLNLARPLNFVEQLNQSFTYLASIAAARWLLERHPECAPLTLNLGTAPGPDIESKCGRFVAETFAVTRPGSNDKLRKDIAKMRGSTAAHRFVFFLSPSPAKPLVESGVKVVQLDHRVLGVLRSVRKDA